MLSQDIPAFAVGVGSMSGFALAGLPEGEGICFGSGPEHEDGKFSIINFFTSVKMAHL